MVEADLLLALNFHHLHLQALIDGGSTLQTNICFNMLESDSWCGYMLKFITGNGHIMVTNVKHSITSPTSNSL